MKPESNVDVSITNTSMFVITLAPCIGEIAILKTVNTKNNNLNDFWKKYIPIYERIKAAKMHHKNHSGKMNHASNEP